MTSETGRCLPPATQVLRFDHEMRNEVTGEIAASSLLTAVYLDLAMRRATGLPAGIRERAAARCP